LKADVPVTDFLKSHIYLCTDCIFSST